MLVLGSVEIYGQEIMGQTKLCYSMLALVYVQMEGQNITDATLTLNHFTFVCKKTITI